MLKVVFTLDYEIHGNGDGCPQELMVEPTGRIMDMFERYGAKLTIMADVAEILKFKEFKEQSGRDDYHFDAIVKQLKDAICRGHDVQLHLHSSYFNARHENGRWQQDWSEYNFAGLPPERLNEVVRIGKEFLENLLKPVSPSYECIAFRAANWSVSPSRNVVRALLNNGIWIDTSVFKYGRREGLVNFDYSHAHSDMVPWQVDENDICRHDRGGTLVEVPIYCENRWVGAFLTASRFHRVKMTRKHSLLNEHLTDDHISTVGSPAGKLLKKILILTQRHAWKADFNQCTGRQLIAALNRAARKHADLNAHLPFILIGHSKQFTQANARSLRPFLEFVRAEKERCRFAKLSETTLSRETSNTTCREQVNTPH
jgi:hypothetical protein